MTILEKIGDGGIVPVAVIDDARNAVPAANAMAEGGVRVIEITLRTSAALGAIRAVADACGDMLVGAGTVLTVGQCIAAVAGGAKFIVSPGYDEEIVLWCLENDITVIPGCVTPTEIMAALKHGLRVLKFFPANIYGGLEAMRALAAPFAGVKFIPTGGVDARNLKAYLTAPFIHAVGGSWLCAKTDIACGDFAKIASLCREASGLAASRQPVLK
jgi:2-dehydro-3-deoxyphosphogluconate aldolase/(4S)-4-hydroxy-2-oxoglutarate aldolase